MTTARAKVVSSDCASVPQVLASQQASILVIRMLFIRPKECAVGVRSRTASGRSHRHAGCVVGCLLGPAVAFGRSEGARASETLEHMRACLDPGGRDLATCRGEDAAALQKGFASHLVLRCQCPHLPELRSTSHVNTRYGRSSAVLGAAAAIHFSLCSLASRGDDCAGLLLVCQSWLKECLQRLRAWQPRAVDEAATRALAAEIRCLVRGLAGVQRASREFDAQAITDSWNSTRFMLACMRKAMWPRAKLIDRESQGDLLKWIDGPAFVDAPRARLQQPRQRLPCKIDVPLSAVPTLGGGGDSSDASSAWDSGSSAASSSLESSEANEANEAPDCDSLAALSDLLASTVTRG